jgi:hypothetical protein
LSDEKQARLDELLEKNRDGTQSLEGKRHRLPGPHYRRPCPTVQSAHSAMVGSLHISSTKRLSKRM